MTRFARLSVLVAAIFFTSTNIHAAETPSKTFKTKYAVVYYSEDKDMIDFVWRLGGERISFPTDNVPASNRIDRVVERVETILDMRPLNFSINIYLHRGELGPDNIAYYENRQKSIHISIDYASDGVFAHEVAHAVIDQYFSKTIPIKVREIITQYVDKYLWSDY